MNCVTTRDGNASDFPFIRYVRLSMSCRSRLVVPAVSTGCSSLAEAVRVSRASERMANSTRPASAHAAGITPVPHAAAFSVFMPSTFCSR